MKKLENLKTVLEIIVILITLSQTFPPLAFLVGLLTIYYILKGQGGKNEDQEEKK